MTRLKRILAAAAVLITGGLTVTVGLMQANQAAAKPLTCVEWRQDLQKVEGAERWTFYVATQQDYIPPGASATRVLGDCTAGECVFGSEGCGTYAYPFKRSALVGGWRLARITAHPYIAGGWKELARDHEEVKFWGAHKDIQLACLSALSPFQCRDLLGSLGDCWRQTDGDLCRHGRLATTNRPGVDEACTVGATDTWYPCQDNGHGLRWGELSRTQELPPDIELDL